MKNHVEMFIDDTPNNLEYRINKFCDTHKLNPISMSVIHSLGNIIAFVVVEGDSE